MKNQIGLSANYAATVNELLNGYLSNIQVSYMNVRGYHWNIVGKQFFQLHAKFEDYYNQLNEMADEVAERILMLGGQPVHAFSKYLKVATIPEKENVSGTEATIKELLSEVSILLEQERAILKLAAENGDDGTVDLMTGYISGQEKLIWMFNAVLK